MLDIKQQCKICLNRIMKFKQNLKAALILLLNIINLLMENIEIYQSIKNSQYFWEIIASVAILFAYALYYLRYHKPHFLIKGTKQLKTKNIGKPPPPYPNGWYNIVSAQQLQPGIVRSVDIAGQNIVVYRGKDKIVYALEAYCLHMGAHLGVGGQVVNDKCIQCPFHGWLYDGTTGHCVDHDGKILELKSVEYNDNLCAKDGHIQWKQKEAEKAKLRKYPVSELNGYIYIWIHAMAEFYQHPIYPLLNVESFIKTLAYRGKTEHHIKCHIQDIPENGADILHFKYVHTYITPLIKSLSFNWYAKWMRGDDPNLPSLFEHKKQYIRSFKQRVLKQVIEPFPKKQFLSIGNLENQINIPFLGKWYMFSATIVQCGLGIVFVILKSPLYQLVFHHYVQPHGRAFQKVFHDCYISNWIPYFVSSMVSELQGGQVTNDMHIWESKKFARKAFIVDERQSDQYIKDWRTWSAQHYQGCEYQLKNTDLSW